MPISIAAPNYMAVMLVVLQSSIHVAKACKGAGRKPSHCVFGEEQLHPKPNPSLDMDPPRKALGAMASTTQTRLYKQATHVPPREREREREFVA